MSITPTYEPPWYYKFYNLDLFSDIEINLVMISGFTRQELTGPFMCDYCGSRFRKYDRSFLTLDNASFLTIQQKRKSKKVVVFQLLFQTEIISLPPMTLTSIPEFDKKSLINNLAKFQFGHESRRNKFNFEIWSIKHPFISPNRAYFNDFCVVKKGVLLILVLLMMKKKAKVWMSCVLEWWLSGASIGPWRA